MNVKTMVVKVNDLQYLTEPSSPGAPLSAASQDWTWGEYSTMKVRNESEKATEDQPSRQQARGVCYHSSREVGACSATQSEASFATQTMFYLKHPISIKKMQNNTSRHKHKDKDTQIDHLSAKPEVLHQ